MQGICDRWRKMTASPAHQTPPVAPEQVGTYPIPRTSNTDCAPHRRRAGEWKVAQRSLNRVLSDGADSYHHEIPMCRFGPPEHTFPGLQFQSLEEWPHLCGDVDKRQNGGAGGSDRGSQWTTTVGFQWVDTSEPATQRTTTRWKENIGAQPVDAPPPPPGGKIQRPSPSETPLIPPVETNTYPIL
jgi:hypothetical protein